MSMFVNIGRSACFSALRLIPKTADDMQILFDIHDGINFIDNEKICQACHCYNMSSDQLDALFVLIKALNHYYQVIVSSLCALRLDIIEMFQNEPEEIKEVFTNEKGFRFFSRQLVNILDGEMLLENFTGKMLESLKMMLKCCTTRKIIAVGTTSEKIVLHMKSNVPLWGELISLLYNKITDQLESYLPTANTILDLLLVEKLTDNEMTTIQNFILEHNQLLNNIGTDVIINNYYDIISENIDDELDCDAIPENWWDQPIISEADNSIFFDDWTDKKTDSGTASKISFVESLECQANQKLAQIGYQIARLKNRWLHNIFDCLVEHGFAENSDELALIIYHTMATEKFTIGYSNKYDLMSLVDHFTLVCLANEISTDYDTFLNQFLSGKNIPNDFPTEILLRVLSRIFNINIVFYTEKLFKILIENALLDSFGTIVLYQFSYCDCYNVVPIGEAFVPIGLKHQLKGRSVSNLSEIIEV